MKYLINSTNLLVRLLAIWLLGYGLVILIQLFVILWLTYIGGVATMYLASFFTMGMIGWYYFITEIAND